MFDPFADDPADRWAEEEELDAVHPDDELEDEEEPVRPLTLEQRRALAHAAVDRAFVAMEEATAAELGDALAARSELATLADGAAVELLPRWEATCTWRAEGCASPVAWLQSRTGARRAAVSSLRRCAHDVADVPALLDAARSGVVSLEHLRLLAALRRRRSAVRTLFDRDVEGLIEAASRLHVEGFARHLELWYHRALAELRENDPDTPPDDLTDESTLRLVRSFQGRGVLHGDLTAEHVAALAEALDARISRWRRDGQLDDDDRPLDQLQAAALLELISEAAVANRRGQARPLVIVTATLAALFERAQIGPGERDRWSAEILGGGPVGAAALRSLLTRANVQLVVTDDDGHPLHVGRAKRLATAAMYAALVATTSGRCEHPSCSAPHHRCHAHHIRWWTRGGETGVDNLALLCVHHHRLVHTEAVTIERRPDGSLAWSRRDGTPIHAPPFTDAA